MFAALWRWLWGGPQITTTREVVRLEDIKRWSDLFNENRQEFVDYLKGSDDSPRYAEDKEMNAKVSIYGGDITSVQVDGIVRSTDSSLTSSDGISGVIERAAGPKLNAKLKSLGGCQEGEAKTTSGFDLPAKHIVHTVGTHEVLPEILERCYKSCLDQMKSKNMKSLAFCCISTGIQGYPNDKAVLVALKTVRLWMEDLKTKNKLDGIDRIVFCLYSEFDIVLYNTWMQVFFPCLPEASRLQICALMRGPPEVNGASHTDQSSGNSCLENSIQLEIKKDELRPLAGFIELTTEPDMISFDDDPNTKRAKMPCGHVIGPDSMTEHFRHILKQGKFKFNCPDLHCNREWDYFLVRHVACFTEEEMCQFEKKLENNYLQKEKGNQRCPGCKTWCLRDQGAGNCVCCPICTASRGKKFNFCWMCLSEWRNFFFSGSCGNPGCSGRDNRIEILAKCDTKKIDYCKNCPTVRGCPKCGMLLEHKDKCGHVNCGTCEIGFCFICLKKNVGGKWQCKPYMGTCELAPRQTTLPGSR